MRPVVLSLLVVLAFVAGGCKSYCRQLSEKVCDCTSSSTEKTNCLSSAANKENSGVLVTAEDETHCQALLTECDCRLIDTPAGKERCGYSVPADGGF